MFSSKIFLDDFWRSQDSIRNFSVQIPSKLEVAAMTGNNDPKHVVQISLYYNYDVIL